MYYMGQREPDGSTRVSKVTERGQITTLSLLPSLRVSSHSPTGFEWGYGGSGPAQLALALLLDVLDDMPQAQRLYQPFKWAKVAGWPTHGFIISAEEIVAWAGLHLGDGSPDEEPAPVSHAAPSDGSAFAPIGNLAESSVSKMMARAKERGKL